tara:strand:+ start:113 stop:433 length:321 start_codon:yes stop_codon:yes gene_type:complete
MNKIEYEDYKQAVDTFFRKEGINGLDVITEVKADNVYGDYEPYFSSINCECCNRSLAGDRYDCTGSVYGIMKEIYEYSVCVDCYYYAEYGHLDDATMDEIAQNKGE